MTKVTMDTKVLDGLIRKMDGSVDSAAGAIAFLIEGKAKMLAPVDTGALKSGIHTEKIGEGHYWVSDSVEYGIFQELGTSKMPAQPFMVPATEATAVEVAEVVGREVFGE